MRTQPQQSPLIHVILLPLSRSEFTLTAIHDAYCEAESYRIILEYMNGGDLLGIIEKENSLDERNARDICYSLVSAITHLHTHSIAHR